MSLTTNTPAKFNYGGQAVLEGVMMRGSKAMTVAVRSPSGEIITHTEPLDPRIYGSKVARWPFLRGLTLLWDALGLGIKALMFSAEVAMEEPDSPGASNGQPAPHSALEGPAQWGTVAFSLSLSVGLFFALPVFLSRLVEGWLHLQDSAILSNLIEGLIRLALLVGYVWLVGLMPDIRRLYGYHGAEHKTINAYEAGAELTPEVVARYPIEHPRCGTAFLLTVVVVSILLYSLFPRFGLLLRVVSRLALLPVIAGIAYEFLRFTARHQFNPFIRLIIRPNLALQHLTTHQPEPEMLEVAIASLKKVLEQEGLLPHPVELAATAAGVPAA